MSKTIDERVVEMRFDNEDFESNAKESLGTLDRLKKALSFKTSTDEIDNLAKSVGNVDMNGLGGAVESVKNKFSALEVIAVTALMNITNKAINAGEALVKSLTLDQVGAGWDKYAQKTTAVQTIMSATANQFTDTATQMEYVNEQLDKLNAFTDETSYNFVDMVGNIGKFTANNIPLDEAVTSMQGIATWAAISGQNASTASRAMYQLSQAMGGGVIRLQDWMSIEQANMATAEFKETALETAVSLGTLTKSADGTYKTLEGNEVTIENFRSTLQDLWFTSDVLTTSLDKYGKFSNIVLDIADQSGLTVTDLIGMTSDLKEGTLDMDHWMGETGKTASELQGYLDILGDEELDLGFRAMRAAQEAKTFQEAIDSVKDAVSTGWMNTFEIIFGDYEQAKTLFTGLANELYDVFAESGNARNELLEEAFSEKSSGWEELANRVDECGVSVDDFKNVLIDTAREHGIEIDKMIEEEGSFEKTLKNGWLSGDLIQEGLSKFTDGLEGVSNSTESAEKRLEELGDVAKRVLNGEFGNGADRVNRLTEAGYDYTEVQSAVNKILKGQELTFEDLSQAELESLGLTEDQIQALKELGDEAVDTDSEVSELIESMTEGERKSGRTLLFESISNTWESIKTIIKAVHDAWLDVFPPTTAEQIYNSFEAVNKFSESLREFAEAVAPTVGRAFKSVFLVIDTFLSVGKQIASFIQGVFTKVFSSLNFKMEDFSGTILDNVQRFHDWVVQSEPVKKALEGIGGAIGGVIDWIMDLVDKFTNMPIVQEALGKIQELFGYLFDKVSQGGPGFLAILDDIKTLISENFPNLTKLVDDFMGSFKNMDSLSLDNILTTLGLLRDDLFTLLTEGIGKGNTFQKTWGKIKTAAKDALDTFNQYIPKFNSGTVLSVGLASSLIATILKFGDLAKAIKSPVSLVNNLFSAMTGAFKNLGTVLKGVALIPLALGIGMIANSIAKLAQLPAGNIVAAGAAIGVVTAAIAGLVYAIGGGKSGKGGLNSFKQIGAIIGELAIVLVAVGAALYAVSKMELDDIVPKLVLLAVVIAAMIGVTFALSKISDKLDSSIGAALTMVAFAASVFILVEALKELANGVVGFKTLEAATESLVDVILSFGIVMSLIAMFGGKNLKGGATSMILMALSIKVLVNALESVKDFNAQMILDNIDGYYAIFAALLALAVIGAIAGKGVGVSMLSLIGSVVLMALVLKMIEALDFSPTQGMLDGFLLILLGLAVIMKAVSLVVGEGKDAKFVQLGAMMLEFSAAIVILIAAMALVGMLPLQAVIQGGIVVAALMVFMAGLIFVTKFAKDVAKEIQWLAIMIGILVGSVALFAFMGPEAQAQIWEGVAAVGAIMAMLAVLIIVTKLAGNAWQGMAMLVAVIASVALAVGLLAVFTDTGEVVAIAEALALIFGTLSVVMIAATIAGAAAAVAIPGLAAMGIAFVVILGLMWILQQLNGEEGTLLKFINSTLPLFNSIGQMVGEFFGGIAEGFSHGAQEALNNLSSGLTSLATALKELTGSVDAETIEGISDLIGAVTLLTADNFIDGIVKLFGGQDPLTKLSEALTELGPVMSQFSKDTEDVKPSSMNAVSNVLNSIVDTADRFTDASNVELMGETLEKFGPQFKTFNDNLKDIDPENVRAMAASLKVFADSASEVQNAAGNGTFDLASVMQGYGYEVPEGYALGQLDGNQLPLDAMDQMFGGLQTKMDLSSIDINQLANLTGGQIPISIGEGTNANSTAATDAIGSVVSNIATALDPVTANTNGYNYGFETVNGTAQALRSNIPLTDEAAKAVNEGIFNQFSSDTTGFYNWGKESADKYIFAINDKDADAKTSGENLTGAYLNIFDEKTPEYLEKGTACVDEFISAFDNRQEDAKTSGTNFSQYALDGVSSNEDGFKTAGENAAQGFVDGLTTQTMLDAARAAGVALGNAALEGAKSKKSLDENSPSKAFHKVGDFGGIAFVQGLIDNAQDAYEAGVDLGGSSVDGVQKAISAMSSYINDNLDANPTITPIMDLSQVRSSSALLASMLNDSVIATTPTASFAARPVAAMNPYGYGLGIQNGVNPQNSMTEINNTFYVQSHDPQGVADETSRIIQRQVVRRDAANGRTGL